MSKGFLHNYYDNLKGKTLGLALTNLGSNPEVAFKKYKELFPESLVTISFTKAKDEWTEPKRTERIAEFISKLEGEK